MFLVAVGAAVLIATLFVFLFFPADHRVKQRGTQNRTAHHIYLLAEEPLGPGDSVISANGRVNLTQQHDGNLCLYEDNRYKWCNGNAVVPAWTMLQLDGSLVQFAGPVNGPKNRVLWKSAPTVAGSQRHGRSAVRVGEDASLSVGVLFKDEFSTEGEDPYVFTVTKSLVGKS